jgi:hypothetical protein
MVTADEHSKTFSDTVELHDFYYSTILDCRAEIGGVFTKAVSDNLMAVFGEYKILVLFKKSYVGESKNYAAVAVRKGFCETVPFEKAESAQITASFSQQPSCTFTYINSAYNNSFWSIQVKGEIKISGAVAEAAASPPGAGTEEPPVSSLLQPAKEKPEESGVWQFEANENISMEQLMDMDLESLKTMEKDTPPSKK